MLSVLKPENGQCCAHWLGKVFLLQPFHSLDVSQEKRLRASPRFPVAFWTLGKLGGTPMSENTRRCKDCGNRTPDRFCKWLGAFLQPGLDDDPDCEGFASQNTCPKSPQKENAEPLIPPTQISKFSSAACPKTQHSDKRLIQTALKIKGLRGSVVMEKICCGKLGCHCQSGALHGPYPYLHYYSNGKVRRRYLSKAMSALLANSTEELERKLEHG